MNVSDLTIRIIILLLPGLIATIVVDNLTVHKPWNIFKYIIYSIILGFFSYFGTYLFINIANLFPFVEYEGLKLWNSLFIQSTPISIREVFYTCVISLFVGFFFSFFIQHKVLFRLARKLRISMKYGDENLFTHVLNSPEIQYVWIRDKKRGFTYEGAVEKFSESDHIQEIFLQDVKVYNYEDSQLLYTLSNIYLSYPDKQITIEVPEG